jgi:hypothetical protein
MRSLLRVMVGALVLLMAAGLSARAESKSANWGLERFERVGALEPTRVSADGNWEICGPAYESESGVSIWLSPDPDWIKQGPMGLNVYQYAYWNPIRFVDPDGRQVAACAPGTVCQNAATANAVLAEAEGTAAIGGGTGQAAGGAAVPGGVAGGAGGSGTAIPGTGIGAAPSGTASGATRATARGLLGSMVANLVSMFSRGNQNTVSEQAGPSATPAADGAPPSDHIVLGLADFGLEQSAQLVGGRTLMNDPQWKNTLRKATADKNTVFTVALDGMRGTTPMDKLMNAVTAGLKPGAAPTNWEMARLWTEGRLQTARLIENGKAVDNPF